MKVISILSGKGGVGKTSVALAITRALARKFEGRVGLLDADVTGSNTHLQLKIVKDIDFRGNRIIPSIAEINGARFQYISIALISESYVKWKGETLADFIEEVFKNTEWNCDFLVIDSPPGLHDENIEILKRTDVVIFVTIPAKFAELDLKRTVDLVRDMEKPVAGVYLNFAYLRCPICGNFMQPFNHPPALNIPVIQEIPFGEISIDVERLLERVNNPVKLPKPKLSVIKRKALYLVLRGLGKLEKLGIGGGADAEGADAGDAAGDASSSGNPD